MFRQSLKKAAPLARASLARCYSSQPKTGGNEPLCAHHKELVPPFEEMCKLKSFELKSDCTTFHLKTGGYDCCCPEPCPKPCPETKPQSPCPPPASQKPKGPCPPENPCDKYKK